VRYKCPHCEAKTISGWAKFTARDLSPAVCRNCGGHSIKGIVRYHPWIELISEFLSVTAIAWLPFALIFYIAVIRSWWPIFIVAVLYTFLLLREHHIAPLIEPNPVQANRAHKIQLVILVLILAAILVYNYFEYGS